MAAVEANGKPEANGGTSAANSCEPKVPDWLEPQLFEDLLKSLVADYKQIKSFKASPALSPGENYATIMLRIAIEVELQSGQTKSLSFMMKVPLSSAFFHEMMKEHNIFDLEAAMYREVVPEFEQMYREAGLDIKFGAACYKLPTAEDYVLLEDLRPRGFKNANRLEGLDVEHTKCVLTRLAQWHAASATRVETKGKYDPKFAVGVFRAEKKELMQQVIDGMAKVLMQCIKTYEGHESYLEKVENLQPKYGDELFRCNKVDPNEFNVLNHGDCWSNNIMFQYDAFGKIKDTYLVDYQIPRYGPPAVDLFYFLLSSTKLEIKIKKFDYFIKYYHDILIKHLTALKYPKKLPTLSEIHAQLYKYGILGYSAVTGVMAAVLLDPTDTANLENFISESSAGSDFKFLMYSNARYKKHIEVLLPWLHNRGALDC